MIGFTDVLQIILNLLSLFLDRLQSIEQLDEKFFCCVFYLTPHSPRYKKQGCLEFDYISPHHIAIQARTLQCNNFE